MFGGQSPIYAHFSETLNGTVTIRAYRDTARFAAINADKLDTNQSAYFHATVANRWLAVRLECIGSGIVTGAVLFVVTGGDAVLPSMVRHTRTFKPVPAVPAACMLICGALIDVVSLRLLVPVHGRWLESCTVLSCTDAMVCTHTVTHFHLLSGGAVHLVCTGGDAVPQLDGPYDVGCRNEDRRSGAHP